MCKQSEAALEQTGNGEWPPREVIGMRNPSDSAVEQDERNVKWQQLETAETAEGSSRELEAPTAAATVAAAAVPAKRKRKGCEPGSSSLSKRAGNGSRKKNECEGNGSGDAGTTTAASGRGRKRALKRGFSNSLQEEAGNEAITVFVHEAGGQDVVAAAVMTNRDDTGQNECLIPGLTYDLSLQCFSRVPRSDHGALRSVCRKWRCAVAGVGPDGRNEVSDARRRNGIKEEWVYMLGGGGHKGAIWRAFDPVGTKWWKLPVCPCDPAFYMCDKESAVAGMQLLVCGQSAMGFIIWRYDLHTNAWSQAPRMLHDRCLFASANAGKYAYFAGGSAQQVTLQLAERYNSEMQTWEALPDLRIRRKLCSGCILDGHFLVVGGQDQDRALTSGEYYDEARNQWVLIENMWPASANMPLVSPAPPLLAVVDNELYAVDATTMELKSYLKSSNSWRTLGRVPARSVDSSGWGMGFKAVGKEIFVIGGSSDRGNGHFCNEIHACTLDSARGEPQWRRVCHLFFTTGFIYNCTVMTV